MQSDRADLADPHDSLVLEGIAVTTGVDGSPHVAPMGPIVDRGLTTFLLRPFQSSQTFLNLKRTGGCVFHVIDNVNLLARAAVGELSVVPETFATPSGTGWILSDCCRWFELRMESLDDSQPRAEVRCSVADQGRRRDFFGWNRAKHAVLEAAILATRIGILSPAEILEQLSRLSMPVAKTAGMQEREAMAFLQDYIERQLGSISDQPH